MMYRFAHLGILAAWLAAGSFAVAQTSPQIDYFYPAGAQRGAQVEVTLGGKYMPGPCGVWISGQGLTSQSETTEGKLSLSIDPKAELGSRSIRIFSVQGGSKPREFLIGHLPEALEVPAAEQQPIELPITFNGRLHPKGDVDQLRFSLSAGQQIVCAAAAEAIGSPSDLVLRLRNAQGRIVATVNDGQGRDRLLVYRCDSPGEHTLEIFDFRLAGGPEHIYRLTITDGPYLDHVFPPGVRQGVSTSVMLQGWNLPGGNRTQLTVHTAGSSHVIEFPGAANRLTLPVGQVAELNEAEPNDESSQPNTVDLPRVINGRFDSPGDQDVFAFAAKKGEVISLEVSSAELGFPADVVMQILSPEGKLIREIDDVRPSQDPSFKLSISADGTYVVRLFERAARGGPRFAYRLYAGPARPRLRLSVKASEFSLTPGTSLTLPTRVERIDGYAEEIEISLDGLPEGVACKPVRHASKGPAEAKLELTAAPKAGFASGAFRIVARAVRDGKPAEQLAVARCATPATSPPVEELWLAIGPKVPFELSVGSTILEAPRLAAFPFPVSIRRDEGFNDPIRLVGVDRDRRGTVVPLSGMVANDKLSGKIPLVIQTMAGEGTTHRCRVMGVAKIKGPDGTLHPVFHVAKGTMLMGCQPNLLTLTAEPQRVTYHPGETFEVTLTVMRRIAMEQITVSLELPAGVKGVTAEPVILSPGESQATISVHVASDAVLPPQFSLKLHAASSREGLPVYAITELQLVAP